jgi:hypothetical protein
MLKKNWQQATTPAGGQFWRGVACSSRDVAIRCGEVFQAYPETARPLVAYHEALLRGPSQFSAGERE